MDVLQEVALQVGIRLECLRQALEGGPYLLHDAQVALVLQLGLRTPAWRSRERHDRGARSWRHARNPI